MKFGVEIESIDKIIERIKDDVIAEYPEDMEKALEEMGKRVAKEVFENVDRTLELLRITIGV